MQRANLERNLFIGFDTILFILLVFEKNQLAVVFCFVIFFISLVIATKEFIKRIRNRKASSQITGIMLRDKQFLTLMIIGSFASAIIALIMGIVAKVLIGVLLLVIIFALFLNILKRIISKRKLPVLLKYLHMDPSINNFEKVIDAYISMNDFSNALIYGDKAIKQYPDNAELLTWKAIVYRRLEEDEKAVPLVKKALEKDPRNKFVRDEASSLQSLGFKVFPPPKSFWKLWP